MGYRSQADSTNMTCSTGTPWRRFLGSTICQVLGHRWWLLFVPKYKDDEELPRLCLRCARHETRSATTAEYREAVKRFLELADSASK